MKHLVFYIVFLIGFTIHAQNTSLSDSRSIFNQANNEEPEFNIHEYVGIFDYNIKKSAKKSSIKLSTKAGIQFSTFLKNHNKKTKDIARINSFILKSTKDMVENFQKNVLKTGDFSNQEKVAKELQTNMKPIYLLLKNENDSLNKKMKNLLSEKQLKKWSKYNKNVFPKR